MATGYYVRTNTESVQCLCKNRVNLIITLINEQLGMSSSVYNVLYFRLFSCGWPIVIMRLSCTVTEIWRIMSYVHRGTE